MRIERLDLVSYGHFRDQTLDLTAPPGGMTIVVGPNEAGKSTTMRALTALLFGIERASRDHFGLGRESMRVAARLVNDEGVASEVVRQGLARLPLTDLSGSLIDESVLSALLGGAGRELFTTLFTIDHEELHNGSLKLLETDGELGQLVFGASLGARDLSKTLTSLDQKADRLFRPRGSTQEINQSLNRYRELQREVKVLRTKSQDWDRKRRDLEDEQHRVQILRADLAAARAGRDGLIRLRAALPHVAARGSANKRLEELRADGVLQSSSWVERTSTIVHDLERELQTREELAAMVDRLKGEITSIDTPTAVLDASERIDRVVSGIGRYRKDGDDLPKRAGELTTEDRLVAELTERLGMTLDQAAAVSDAQLSQIEQLAADEAVFNGARAAAETEQRKASAEIVRLQSDLDALPAAINVDTLRQRLKVAGTAALRISDAAAELVALGALESDIQVGVSRLGLSAEIQLELLVAPSQRQIQQLLQERTTLTTEISQRQRDVTELEHARSELIALRDSASRAPGVPALNALADARARREDGWRLVRKEWLGGGADPAERDSFVQGIDLPDAYEAAVVEADSAADERFDQAAAIQSLIEIDLKINDVEARRTVRVEELAERNSALVEHDERWATTWKGAGLVSVIHDSAPELVTEITELQSQATDLRRRRAALEGLESEIIAQQTAIASAIVTLGGEPAHDQLEPLLLQAQEIIESADEVAAARTDLSRQIKTANEVKTIRSDELNDAVRKVDDWRAEWMSALAPLLLDPGSSAATARSSLTILRELRAKRHSVKALRERVAGITSDIQEFETLANGLIDDVSPDLAGGELLGALGVLKRRLDQSRATAERLRILNERVEVDGEHLAQAIDRVMVLEDSLLVQRKLAGMKETDDLDSVLARSQEGVTIQAQIYSAESNLLEQSAGLTVESVIEAAAVYEEDPIVVNAAIETAATRVEELEGDLVDVGERLNAAKQALESIDGSGRASDAEQEAEIELAGLAASVNDYVRFKLANELLKGVVAEFSRSHHAPIVESASRYFSIMTNNAFSGLVVDDAGIGQKLLACRRNGQLEDIPQLSDGSTDQLYLALRIAGIEHHLNQNAEPLPVVLDDLLVNFSDDRASAAFSALAELGERTQVLLFTHHDHLVGLAEAALGSHRLKVARLAPRNHELPPMRSEEGATYEPARGAHGEATEAILDVLRSAREPLGRNEIVERCGVADAAWGPAIRQLVDAGAVEQKGIKRGAKYQLP